MTKPTVSVVVPVYKDWSRLNSCLNALSALAYPKNHITIIVVKNDNTDGWPVPPDGLEVVTKVCEKPGAYAARNVGIKEAAGDVVAFTDADCLPSRDWLFSSASIASNTGSLVTGPITLFPKVENSPNCFESYDILTAFDNKKRDPERPSSFAPTANLIVSTDVVKKLGGFEEGFFSGGDQEFSNKAKEAGYNLEFVRSCEVFHPARPNLSSLITKTRRVAESRLSKKVGQKKASEAFRIFVPPFRTFYKIITRGNFPLTKKLCPVGVLFFLYLVKIYCLVRVFRGKSLERR